MNKTRRAFLKTSLQSSLSLPLFASGLGRVLHAEDRGILSKLQTGKKLNILILGGTSFLGIHQIAYALGRGHSISIFTRGKTKPTYQANLFDEVEHLIGDRKDNLKALENRSWDAVIDNSGHDVSWTESTAALLKDRCELYLYTSSTGVFYPYLGADYAEDDEVLLQEPEVIEAEVERMEYWYGVMKANSELAAKKHFGPDRTIIVRPTYMIGPADKTDRFIHWPIRLAQGGDTLVPGKTNDPVQYIDVRDVAQWMIRLIENKTAGTFNAVGPATTQTMPEFVAEASKAFYTPSNLIQIDDYDFLAKHGVHDIVPWIMPTGKNRGSSLINNHKALDNGLILTPLVTTVMDTHTWWNSDAVSQEKRDKVIQNPDSVLQRETELLRLWNEQRN